MAAVRGGVGPCIQRTSSEARVPRPECGPTAEARPLRFWNSDQIFGIVNYLLPLPHRRERAGGEGRPACAPLPPAAARARRTTDEPRTERRGTTAQILEL